MLTHLGVSAIHKRNNIKQTGLTKMAKVTRTNSKNKKSTSRIARISAHLKSHKKTTAAVSVIMIALIGGLYVRFSSAATGYTWTGRSILIGSNSGVYTKKQDGRIAVQSSEWRTKHSIQVYVNSSVSNNDTYCFSGKATKELRSYWITYGYTGPTNRTPMVGVKNVLSGGPDVPGSTGRVGSGDFFVCGKVPGRPAGLYLGYSRFVQLEANSDGVFAVYQVGRAGY